MTVEHRIDDPTDQFPIGMRVLAVDDDPTCLKLLETLLRRCKYHVTTTSQARTALNMLRENKNKFDLVISDVHMPDMDGFKLLELVGLEMDLPVIMLSANGDTKLVMKGISHGACDYLLKPVRIEELKNIWQHVLRRKKFDSRSQKLAANGGEGDPGSAGSGGLEQNGKATKKRKDQDEDDDDERDENGDDNDDPSTQKKPRVVWSVELHRKFVAAVHQLGIDKAVPKKILDLMNVEKLTRENVASHLQKYRLYLKRISCVANQQANMAVVFNTDPSYLRMNSMNGHGNFNQLAMSVPFQNQAFRSFSPGGMIGRLNTPANMGLNLPTSGGMVHNHVSQSPNPTNCTGQIKYHDPSMIQRMPLPFELDQQHNKGGGASHIGDLSTTIIDESTGFPLSTAGLADTKIPSNELGVANSMLMVGHGQDAHSLKSEYCSSVPDPGRCTDSWSNSAQSSSFQSNTYPLSDCFKQTSLHNSTSRDNTIASRIVGNQFDGSSMSSVPPIQSHNPIADMQFRASVIGNSTWDNHNKMDANYRLNPSILTGSVDPMMPISCGAGVMSSLDHSLDMRNTIFQRDMDFNSMGQPNYGDTSMVRYDEVEKSTFREAKLKQEYVMTTHQQRPQGGYIMNHFGSLGDVVNGTMKQEHNKVEGDFDAFSLGSGNIM